MMRTILLSLAMMGFTVALGADDKDKKGKEAKITKIDAKKGTATVKEKSGTKAIDKTYKLAEDIEYMDSTGKVSTLDIFTSGDHVIFIESEGRITKMKKNEKEARITKIDAKAGTVTVMMNSDGKDVEKTFKLAENIEFMDSKGDVAAADIFTSGDMVLYVEADGCVCKLKKEDKSAKK